MMGIFTKSKRGKAEGLDSSLRWNDAIKIATNKGE